MEFKTLIITLNCELHQGCKAVASGHSDFANHFEFGTTPDEARGHLIRSLYLKGLLLNPVTIVFENTPDLTAGIKPAPVQAH